MLVVRRPISFAGDGNGVALGRGISASPHGFVASHFVGGGGGGGRTWWMEITLDSLLVENGLFFTSVMICRCCTLS